MASQRIPSVLAMEVPVRGKAPSAERHPSVDSPDGTDNPTWGQERIANELKLKLGIRVSPRTVSKYLSQCPRRKPPKSMLFANA